MWILKDYASQQRIRIPQGICKKRKKQGLSLLVSFVAVLISTIVVRLYDIQVVHSQKWKTLALKQHFNEIRLSSPRGSILDRNGNLLAVSVPAGSVFIRPKILDREKLKGNLRILSEILKMSEEEILAKAASDEPFVWVSRQIPRTEAEKVRSLRIKGLDYLSESRRYYPYGRAAAQLIGMVGVDGQGLSGVELSLDRRLRGKAVRKWFARDGIGKAIDPLDEKRGKGGDSAVAPVSLTIDSYIQLIMDEELERGVLDAHALRGVAVMVDSETGEVLGVSQTPFVDFNKGRIPDPRSMINAAAQLVYEPGSTLKPIVAAAAIEKGVVKEDELINCEEGRYRFGRKIIRDVHPISVVPFRRVVIESSNIGIAKIGVRLGEEALYNYLKKFGFGEFSGTGIPGESRGILRPVNRWAKIDVATHSFGQGIAVTPFQMVRAISAIANDGLMPSLSLVKPPNGTITYTRVVSPQTARKVQAMLMSVVEDARGTGKRAYIKGVRVSGKTGTAQKPKKNGVGYSKDRYVASFVGFVDGSPIGVHRTLSLIVIIDEPKGGSIFGGTVAAPVFRRIMIRTLNYLGMQAGSGVRDDIEYMAGLKQDKKHQT